jgi:hypothetical protein
MKLTTKTNQRVYQLEVSRLNEPFLTILLPAVREINLQVYK